jgi:hypothetical protein
MWPAGQRGDGKVRASVTKHRGDIGYQYTPLQQLFCDPFVGDTSIGLWESLWNVQPSQPGMIEGTRQRAVTRRDWQIGKLRVRQRSGRGGLAVRPMNVTLGGLHQRDSLRSWHQVKQMGEVGMRFRLLFPRTGGVYFR